MARRGSAARPSLRPAMRWSNLVSAVIIAALLVIVASSAIVIHERDGEWWTPILAPLGALALLVIGAVLRQPDKPLAAAISHLLDLPSRRPRTGMAVAALAVAAAGLLLIFARDEVIKPDGIYWVQLYRGENITGQRAQGLEVVMERQAGPGTAPEILKEITDEHGSAHFPVWLNQMISVRVERANGREYYPLNPAVAVTADKLGQPIPFDITTFGAWKKRATEATLLGRDEGVVGVLSADPYFFRWTNGLPQQQPIGEASLEAGVAPFGLPPAESVIRRQTYTVGFSPYLRLPRWVAYRILPEAVRIPRRPFSIDPAVPATVQASDADYRSNPFDRGHLVRPSDVSLTEQDSRAANFLTTVTPQTDVFNQRVWSAVEQFATALGTTPGHQTYIVRGPLFLPSANGTGVQVRVIGPGRLPVPSHFFQVVLDVAGGQQRLHCFVVPNEFVFNDLPREKADIPERYRARLSSIEDATGLQLFPRLDRASAPGC